MRTWHHINLSLHHEEEAVLFPALLSWSEDNVIIVFVFVVHDFDFDGVGCGYDVDNGGGGSVVGGGGDDDDDYYYDSEEEERWGSCFWEI